MKRPVKSRLSSQSDECLDCCSSFNKIYRWEEYISSGYCSLSLQWFFCKSVVRALQWLHQGTWIKAEKYSIDLWGSSEKDNLQHGTVHSFHFLNWFSHEFEAERLDCYLRVIRECWPANKEQSIHFTFHSFSPEVTPQTLDNGVLVMIWGNACKDCLIRSIWSLGYRSLSQRCQTLAPYVISSLNLACNLAL